MYAYSVILIVKSTWSYEYCCSIAIQLRILFNTRQYQTWVSVVQFRFASYDPLRSFSNIEKIDMYILIQLDCLFYRICMPAKHFHAGSCRTCLALSRWYDQSASRKSRTLDVHQWMQLWDAVWLVCNIERVLYDESHGKSCAMYNVRLRSTINFLSDFISVKFMLPNSLSTRTLYRFIIRSISPFPYISCILVHNRIFDQSIFLLCSRI
jgi:hypothetical protein